MRWVTAFLMLGCAIFQLNTVTAQQYPFVHYTPKDGLVSARARTIFQDSKGRLYITSFGGLSVYDGARFTNYTMENGLAANYVNDVLEIGKDSIWIFPNIEKLQCIVRGKLKNITTIDGIYPVVNKLIKATDESYYALADEGLFRFEKNRFVRLELKAENGKEINKYFSNGCEINGRFFLVTGPTFATYPAPSYLVVHDRITGKSFISKKPPEVYDVIASPQGDILASTNEGLKAIDKQALEKGEINFIAPPFPYVEAKNWVANSVYFDRKQNLWLTRYEGVYKIDQQGQVMSYSLQNGLLVNQQYSVFDDAEDNVWFANEQTGISKLSNSQFEFYSQIKPGFVASDLYADKHSDSVWLLDHVQKKLLVIYPGGSREFAINEKSGWLFRFIPGKEKNYLTGYFEVFNYGNTKSNIIDPQLIRNYRDSLQGVPVVNFPMPDGYGNLLYSNFNINVALQNSKVYSYPLHYFGDQFVVTPENHLWITTRSQKIHLFRIHPENPENYFELLRTYDSTIVPPGPRSIAIDKSNNLWIGTRDLGIFCLAVDSNYNLRLKHQINSKTGLSDNCILNLYADEDGNIWMCSPVGLDKAGLKDGKWMVENVTRGSNIYQNVLEINQSKNGNNWVLTRSGIIKILAANQGNAGNFKPNILLTEIRTGRDTLDFLANSPGISYKKNDLYFQWAVPTFKDEKQTRFSYLLEGSNRNEWSQPSNEAMIRFINLPPGKYVFRVKATFPNGLYPDTEASYAFEILPPWWETWWFKVLAVVALFSAVIVVVRSYVRKKLRDQLHALEKKQAIDRERRRIASDMHDDLGAGLTSIRFLSQKVKENSVNVSTQTEIGKIANISGELFENMNEIIWAMNEKNDTLEDLLLYTRAYAKEYCEEHHLDCIDDFPETIPAIFVSGEVRRNIFLTIKESFHNVVKHSSATRVELNVCIDEQLSIEIKDNGKGFTTANGTQYRGGNGLINMQKRIQSIGGQLKIIHGEGITVHLNVSLQKLEPGTR